jgi:hypothetical protein
LHPFTQLRDTECAGRGEVLVDVHADILVAFATSCKRQMLRVAHATLPI